MKVVYNSCYGGFNLSRLAISRYWEIKGETKPDRWSDRDIDRADPILVQVVEELKQSANGSCAYLSIEDVPSGSLWRIDEYDGNESVMTQNDYDWKIAT